MLGLGAVMLRRKR
ncbi:MAG: hypothetical protein FVQ85_10925 [Planctomycetes bacterium]|nr:hypothetical protein [Planctomycetota bacterium]